MILYKSSHKVTRIFGDVKFYNIFPNSSQTLPGTLLLKFHKDKTNNHPFHWQHLTPEKLIPTPLKLCRGQLDPTSIPKCFVCIIIIFQFRKLLWSYYQLTSFKCKPSFQVDFHCRGCLAQIRFVINAPKQVTKPKGLRSSFDHADIVNKIMNR